MKLKDKLRNLQVSKSCLLATNFYNYETLEGILIAASESGQPVILQLTKSSIDYMGLAVAVGMARAALKSHQVEGWLHLDHSDSYELVEKCLDAGFDSVMIDASERPFRENIAVTERVVALAEKYEANVEAELGYVAKLGQSKEKVGFTDPEEARLFVEETGVDALAVAIGSAHGFYTGIPKLDLDLLEMIREAVRIPLVLHGGSGIPGEMLQDSIRRGICKINLATEIKNIFMQTLQYSLNGNCEIDLRKVFPPATQAVASLVREKFKIVAGRGG